MKPERVFRIGAISASVFVNEVDGEGGKRTVRNVNLQRRYKDGEDWKSSSSFSLADPRHDVSARHLPWSADRKRTRQCLGRQGRHRRARLPVRSATWATGP